jgi:hypothetical protein
MRLPADIQRVSSITKCITIVSPLSLRSLPLLEMNSASTAMCLLSRLKEVDLRRVFLVGEVRQRVFLIEAPTHDVSLVEDYDGGEPLNFYLQMLP